MLPADAPVQVSETGAAGGAAAANWLDRWIDIIQVVPRVQADRPSQPATASSAPEPESSGIPHFVVILAFFAFLLIFATIEIMLRNNERQK